MEKALVLETLESLGREFAERYRAERRVLSFEEWLELFAEDPVRHTRDAARYLRDLFDHHGTVRVRRGGGETLRWKLFDLEFLPEDDRREALVGQESVQAEVYRCLQNFVKEGHPNRVVLLHGPNGSAKSTVAACIHKALEHYSTLDEGALYRIHWVFPTESKLKGTIGFGGPAGEGRREGSYALLPESEIDARLFVEVRDHPLFLLPEDRRRALLERAFSGRSDRPNRWILRGGLSHKSRQVFDALLASYQGDYREVLRHVQVERYFISRRYRVGAITLGPELSVDAGERQLTVDRSLGSLPSALASVSLFEAHGELVDASGGVLELSDLLKRPIDSFKYLQITAETSEVSLGSQNLPVNCVMLGSANELHLAAFRQHPEFESFRGRFELIRAGYLLDWRLEQQIYDAQVARALRASPAPHATRLAAQFAVLTRMRKPAPERYSGRRRQLVEELSAVEKMDLYAGDGAPLHLDGESRQLLVALVPELLTESAGYPIYEGSVGASPREMRTLLLDAAQDPRFSALHPLGVLDQLDALCRRTSDHAWLGEDRLPGGYHDHELFRALLRERLLDTYEEELGEASGLVEEGQWVELLTRYIQHVSHWVKGEKLENPVTGALEDADLALMSEVEALLGEPGSPEEVRHSVIARIAAWAIEEPDRPLDTRALFAGQLRRLREAVYAQKRGVLARRCRDIVTLVHDHGAGLAPEQREGAEQTLQRLRLRFGHSQESAGHAALALLDARFAALVS